MKIVMHLKMKLTCLLLSISSIFAQNIDKSTQQLQTDENEFSNVSSTRNTGLSNMKNDKSNNVSPKIDVISRIANNNLTVKPKPPLNLNVSDNDSKDKRDSKAAETRGRRGRRYPKNFDDSDIFDEIENDFSFDEMGSDVRGYDSYHGSPTIQKKKKRRYRKGHVPRYPPIDRDMLYEFGLLIYLRDFHLGMII